MRIMDNAMRAAVDICMWHYMKKIPFTNDRVRYMHNWRRIDLIAITSTDYAAIIGCSRNTALRHLNALSDAGLMIRRAMKRGTSVEFSFHEEQAKDIENRIVMALEEMGLPTYKEYMAERKK